MRKNIILYNIIKAMDKKIDNDMALSVKIIKNDFECIGERCVIYSQCCNHGCKRSVLNKDSLLKRAKKRKKCEWDLQSKFYEDASIFDIVDF